jgi:hypothetical protein
MVPSQPLHFVTSGLYFFLRVLAGGVRGFAFTALSSTGVRPEVLSVAPDGISVVVTVWELSEPV